MSGGTDHADVEEILSLSAFVAAVDIAFPAGMIPDVVSDFRHECRRKMRRLISVRVVGMSEGDFDAWDHSTRAVVPDEPSDEEPAGC